MFSRTRVFVAPAYLFACLVLGGSAQGVWQNMVLQLAGIGILAWAASDVAQEPLAPAARHILLLVAFAVGAVGLQMVPLPASIWTHLGPRARISADFHTLGIGVPAEPLSVSPALGLNALLGIIPPLAIFCVMVRMKAYRPNWLAVALVAGTVAGIALGALQVATYTADNPQLSSWYLYQDTNEGRAVGFFANANHMANLLVVTIPFLAALARPQRRRSVQTNTAIMVVLAGTAVLIVAGIFLNQSLAGYALALPVLALSAIILLPPRSSVTTWMFALGGLLLIVAPISLERTSIGGPDLREDASFSVQSREDIFRTSAHVVSDFMPFGSGLGSFATVYPLYEHPEYVTDTYVVHAHNDYIEIAVELGIAGIVLILLFFVWWVAAVWRAWRSAEGGPFARAAAVASAVVLVHSMVDFPLRTASIATCFAACLALLAGARKTPVYDHSDFRPTRHRRI
jgi:O-antigen ligase